MKKRSPQWWATLGALLGTILYSVLSRTPTQEEKSREMLRRATESLKNTQVSIPLPTPTPEPERYVCGDYEYIILEDGTAELTACRNTETDLALPDEVDGYSVTVIGKKCFLGNPHLVRVTLPDSITEIGISAFQDCSSLLSINIPDSVIKVGANAFSGCTRLVDIRLSEK